MSIKDKTNSRCDNTHLETATIQVGKVLDTIIPGWRKNSSTEDTARRFIEYLAEYTQDIPLKQIFKTFDHTEGASHSIISQINIPFRGVCEHHLLPMWGRAHFGYIPSKKVIGLSKISRLIEAVGVEKPSLQEYYADRILKLFIEHLEPQGCMLIIESEHSCMACRGVAKPDVPTVTSVVDGIFAMNPNAKQEFMDLVKIGKMGR